VFTPEAPGKVVPVKLGANQSIICQRDAFMCAETTVNLAMHFRKRLGTGLFGGEGFILQRITGPGYAFLEIPGEIREYSLADGEAMRIDPGHIALFEPTVTYDITMVKGLTNVLFGGEGLAAVQPGGQALEISAYQVFLSGGRYPGASAASGVLGISAHCRG